MQTRRILNANIAIVRSIVGDLSYDHITIFTELWTWAAAVTDLSISIVIIYALERKKTGYNMPTDSLIPNIIYATMESASMTTFFAVAAAVVYIATWQYETYDNAPSVNRAFAERN